MRHEPAGIDGVAVKAPADVVMHEAARAMARRVWVAMRTASAPVSESASLELGAAEEKAQHRSPGELGRATEPSLPGVGRFH